MTAVRGNTDPPSLDVPATETLEADGVTFAVTHGTGSPAGWHERVVETALEEAGPDAVAVAGHTHDVVDTVVEGSSSGDGIRVLNPGSATGASPADGETMLVATVDDGTLEVERRSD